MKTRQLTIMLLLMSVLMLGGCASHQTHERTIEELEITNQNSAKEIERLQSLTQKAEATQRIQEKELGNLKQERQELTSNILALQETIGGTTNSGNIRHSTATSAPPNYEDLSQTLQQLRMDLEDQYKNFSRIRSERETLSKEVKDLETRLAKIVDQSTSQANLLKQQVQELKVETDQIREEKEREAAQLAQIQQERQAIEGEIGQVANTFKQQIGKDLRIQQEKDRLVLTVLGKVLFESGKAQLTPLGLEVMSQIGEVLSKFPNKYIHVEGHTDTRPIFGKLQEKYQTNWELSTARATTVLRFLIEKTKMPHDHFVATGYADTHPVAANDTEDGRSGNRRVEIVLYPKAMFSKVTGP